jgi:hypothetical protein
MFLEIPLRWVGHLGKDQRRLDRVERFGEMKLLVVRIGPRAGNVGDELFGAPLGEQPRPKLIAAPVTAITLMSGNSFSKSGKIAS